MTRFSSPTRGSSWVVALLLGVCATTSMAVEAQDALPAGVEPLAPDPEPGRPADVDPSPTPIAAVDVSAEIVALRAEVDALKAAQEEASIAALLSEGAESAAEPELIRIYGFMDVGIDKYFFSDDDELSLLRPTGATTFVFGNLNLYFDANPVEYLRTMIEVRLTLAPNGEETDLGPPIGTSYERIDTTAFDFSSPSSQSQLRLGGLYIERAWSEYQFSDLIKVQWGLFLNPFGIWNLDHGSPTLISLMLPTFIASQMVPTRLLGIHVYGSAFFGSSELGYALHVTNGRTPFEFALSEDKGLGARAYLAEEGDGSRLVVGMSGYWGRYLDQERRFTPAGPGIVSLIDVVDYTEAVVGLDVALDFGDLRVRSEAVLRWVNYKDGKSERSITDDGRLAYLPNRLEYAGYVIAAYRTPWRLEPYVEAELSSKSAILPRWAGEDGSSTANIAALFLSVGLNVELTTHTLFKTQLVWDTAYDREFKKKGTDTPILFMRAVNSF